MSAQGIIMSGAMAAPSASMARVSTIPKGLGSTALICQPGFLRSCRSASGLSASQSRRAVISVSASADKGPRVTNSTVSYSASTQAAPEPSAPVMGEVAKAAGGGAVFGLLVAVAVKMLKGGASKPALVPVPATRAAPAVQPPPAEKVPVAVPAGQMSPAQQAMLGNNELRKILPRSSPADLMEIMSHLSLDQKKAVVPSLRGEQVEMVCKSLPTDELKAVIKEMDGLEVTTVLQVLDDDALKAVLPLLSYRNRSVAAALSKLSAPALAAITPMLPAGTIVAAAKQGLIDASTLNVMIPLLDEATLAAVAQSANSAVLADLKTCLGPAKVAALLPPVEEAPAKVVVKKASAAAAELASGKSAAAQGEMDKVIAAPESLSAKEIAALSDNGLRHALPRVPEQRITETMKLLSLDQKKAVIPSLREEQVVKVCEALKVDELTAVIKEMDGTEVTTVLKSLPEASLKAVLPVLAYRNAAIAAAVPSMSDAGLKAVAPILAGSTVINLIKGGQLDNDRAGAVIRELPDAVLKNVVSNSPESVRQVLSEVLGAATVKSLLPTEAPKKPFVEVKLKSPAMKSEENVAAKVTKKAARDPYCLSDSELATSATANELRAVLPRSTIERSVDIVALLPTKMKKAVIPSLRGEQLEAVVKSMGTADLQAVVPELDGLEVTTALDVMSTKQIKEVLPLLQYRNRAVASALPGMDAATIKQITPDLPAATIISAFKEGILSAEMIAVMAPLIPETTLRLVATRLPTQALAALEETMGKDQVAALLPVEPVEWEPMTIVKAKSPEVQEREAADKAAKAAAKEAVESDPSALSDADLAKASDNALRKALTRATDDRLMAVMALLSLDQKKAVVPSLRGEQVKMVCKSLTVDELKVVMKEMDGLEVTTVLQVLDDDALKAVLPLLSYRNRSVAAALPAMSPVTVKEITPLLPAATILAAVKEGYVSLEMFGVIVPLLDDAVITSVLAQMPADAFEAVSKALGPARMGAIKVAAATAEGSEVQERKTAVKARSAAALKVSNARAAAAAAEAAAVANPDALSDADLAGMSLNAVRRVMPRLSGARISNVLGMLTVEQKAAVVTSLRGEQVVGVVRDMYGDELKAVVKEMDGLEVTKALEVMSMDQLKDVLPLLRLRNRAVAAALPNIPVATMREITPLLPQATVAIAFTEDFVDAATMAAMCPEISTEELAYVAGRMSSEGKEKLLAAVGPKRMAELEVTV